MRIAPAYRRRSHPAVLTLVCYWVTLFVLTHISGNELARVPIRFNDFLAHCAAYAILTVLFTWAFLPSSTSLRGYFLTTFGILMTYALVDELLQNFVPGRVAALSDVFANGLGIFVVLMAQFAVSRTKDRRLKTED